MKTTQSKLILAVLLALAGGFTAQAQSNRNNNDVPGSSDYAQFSRFISDRNIFDPNRVPRSGGTRVVRTRTRTRTAGAPYVTLVGTMSYEKGLFAFFDSNNEDMKKIVGTGDAIGIYTVKDIAKNMVTLAGKDKKEFSMKVGEQMRQEGGTWQVTEASDSGSSAAPAETSSGGENSNSTTEAATPSSNLEANDVLKRLMQLREKENQ